MNGIEVERSDPTTWYIGTERVVKALEPTVVSGPRLSLSFGVRAWNRSACCRRSAREPELPVLGGAGYSPMRECHLMLEGRERARSVGRLAAGIQTRATAIISVEV